MYSATPAKFRKHGFGALPSARRLTFTFNAYPTEAGAQYSTNTIRNVIAGALSNWNLVNGTSGVSVTQLAGINFFRVVLSVNVYNTYTNDQAARGLADDLGRNFIVSALTVNGADSNVTGGNIFGTGAGSSSGTYTVRSGDTLSKIAAQYGTTWQALATLNGLSNPNRLEVGQVLRISNAAPSPSTTSPVIIPTEPTGSPTTPTVTTQAPKLEQWASALGLSASAFLILAVVGGMIVLRRD